MTTRRGIPDDLAISSTQDFDYPADATLMSVTDTQSYVSYANAAFLDVSGYSLDEMLGRPHNIVRHPDMPKEAFADLWATLRQGHTWSAHIKNRRANGGEHYWVRANVTPVRSGGDVVGYMSVRTRPNPDETEAAESLYRDFGAGRAQRKYAFHKGVIMRKGLFAWSRLGRMLPVRWRIRIALGAMAIGDVTTQIQGMRHNNQRTLHDNENLRARTEQTSAHLQQVTATAHQMATSVEQGAGAIANVREMTTGASAAVTAGSEALNQVLDTIKEIARYNEQIAEMNRLIDTIASQTNLLALNAAVEAQGKHPPTWRMRLSDSR